MLLVPLSTGCSGSSVGSKVVVLVPRPRLYECLPRPKAAHSPTAIGSETLTKEQIKDDKVMETWFRRHGTSWVLKKLIGLGAPQLVLRHIANYLANDARVP